MKNPGSRRYFLKTTGSLIGAAFLGLWGSMIHTQKKTSKQKIIRLPLHNDRQVLFHDDCILIQEEKPVVLSSYCTHLGCRINTYENGLLECPCHGSTFDLEGKPTKGPATAPLKKLDYSIDTKTQTINISI